MNSNLKYLNLFNTGAEALEFEVTCLAIGDEFLPEVARVVRDGGKATSEYWDWLITQAEAEGFEPSATATVVEPVPEENDGVWTLRDQEGGVWWPRLESDGASAEAVLATYRRDPMLGDWRN